MEMLCKCNIHGTFVAAKQPSGDEFGKCTFRVIRDPDAYHNFLSFRIQSCFLLFGPRFRSLALPPPPPPVSLTLSRLSSFYFSLPPSQPFSFALSHSLGFLTFFVCVANPMQRILLPFRLKNQFFCIRVSGACTTCMAEQYPINLHSKLIKMRCIKLDVVEGSCAFLPQYSQEFVLFYLLLSYVNWTS